MDDATIYDGYVAFSKVVGSPVLDFESWSRKRHARYADDIEADRIREKWLASEADVKMPPPTRARLKERQ